MDAKYLDAVRSNAPHELATKLHGLPDGLMLAIDTTIRLISGAPFSPSASICLQSSWCESQQKVSSALAHLKSTGDGSSSSSKRSREEGDDSQASQKKAKTSDTEATSEDDLPLFTLHALSLTAPIRKKADITIHRHTLRLTNPSTHSPEHPPIPLSALRRAFLLPTRGKTKPHWSVLLLPSDMPAATGKAAAKESPAEAPQIAFGLDATPGAFTTTAHDVDDGATTPTAHPKGTLALPSLQAFLAHLPMPVREPIPGAFRSAASGSGEPIAGVEAYRGAKNATLWFLDDGVLWDGRPAEFWPLNELAPGDEGAEGVRVISATGRTCSVILRRLVERKDFGEGEDEADKYEAVDTDFGMVDGKEQDPIQQWVRKRRSRFGGKEQPVDVENGAMNGVDKGKGKAMAVEDDDSEDDSDEDFTVESEDSDGGSPTEDSDSDAGADEAEAEASDEDGEGDAEDEDDEELKPKNHPLLRPGAMPKHVSKAAMDMVVGIVEQDIAGSLSAAVDEIEEEEEDQLED